MRSLHFVCRALGMCAGVAIVTGCGGLQSRIGPGALPQTTTIAAPNSHPPSVGVHASGIVDGLSTSAYNNRSSNGDLLYVPAGSNQNAKVFIVSYPGGKPVGTLTGFEGALGGICSDSSGNVFIISGKQLLEYAHGGKTAINTLSIPGGSSCASDPTSGNLAVTDRSEVLVFANARGKPKIYTDSDSDLGFRYCAYDGGGNLFLNSGTGTSGSQPYELVELPAKSNTFNNDLLKEPYFGDLHWDGKYLAIDQFDRMHAHKIERVKVSGSRGTVVATINLAGGPDFQLEPWGTWLQGNTFISPVSVSGHDPERVYFWAYPSGGKASKMLPRGDFPTKGSIWSVTVSVAPSNRASISRSQK